MSILPAPAGRSGTIIPAVFTMRQDNLVDLGLELIWHVRGIHGHGSQGSITLATSDSQISLHVTYRPF
jgi:hypothetical protein